MTPAPPRPEFTVDSHYVPKGYLKGWSENGKKVWCYRTLVPHEDYPWWESRSIRSLGCFPHLYTSVRSGAESDDVEKWLQREFENPADAALRRVRAGEPVSKADLERLVLYAAALDLRTPASYLEFSRLAEQLLPSAINSAVDKAVEDLQKGQSLRATPNSSVEDIAHIEVKLDDADGDNTEVTVSATIGREMWLWQMQHTLSGVARVLLNHKWGFLRPHPPYEWFTSDHPVLRVNYNSDLDFNFGGGWGFAGSELILPISPTRALYTKVGSDVPDSLTLTPRRTLSVLRLIAKRGHRWIVARGTPWPAPVFRPREVDRVRFDSEQEAIRRWNAEHAQAHGVNR